MRVDYRTENVRGHVTSIPVLVRTSDELRDCI